MRLWFLLQELWSIFPKRIIITATYLTLPDKFVFIYSLPTVLLLSLWPFKTILPQKSHPILFLTNNSNHTNSYSSNEHICKQITFIQNTFSKIFYKQTSSISWGSTRANTAFFWVGTAFSSSIGFILLPSAMED